MKKIILPVLLVLIAAGLFGLYYFRNSLPAISSVMHSNGPVWNYDKAIASPITGKSGSLSDVTLGAVATNGVSMTVPKGSFDTDTSIQLQTPASVPSYTSASMTPAGTPIEVTASTKTRLNDQTMITIRFDQTKLPKGTQADHMRVAYYDGTVWEFITPTSVDMSAGTMTFGTYHFSLFGPSVASDATIKKSWVHTQALTNQLKNPPGKASDIVAGQIITLTLEKMGVTDPAAAEKVRQNLEADPNYARIASTYTNNDEVMVTNIAKIVGTKIAEEVPKEMFTNHTLQHAGETPGDVAAVAKAVGYISEGNYTEAAKEIGEQIADKFIITTAGKIAIEVTKAQIANWKDGGN